MLISRERVVGSLAVVNVVQTPPHRNEESEPAAPFSQGPKFSADTCRDQGRRIQLTSILHRRKMFRRTVSQGVSKLSRALEFAIGHSREYDR